MADHIRRAEIEMGEQRRAIVRHFVDLDWSLDLGPAAAAIVDEDHLPVGEPRQQRPPARPVAGDTGDQQQRLAFAADLVVDAGHVIFELRHAA